MCVLSLAVAALKWHSAKAGEKKAAESQSGEAEFRAAAPAAIGKSRGASKAEASRAASQSSAAVGPAEGTAASAVSIGEDRAGSAAGAAVLPSRPDARRSCPPSIKLSPPSQAAAKILEGAKTQVREGAVYTPGYFKLDYPNGDIPRDKGVCADVIVRALRCAGLDLQKLIHEDMKTAFDSYPQSRIWGLTRPDPNIDHRRVPNQIAFFSRHGLQLAAEFSPATRDEWLPGDIVFWKLPNGKDHCGIVSDAENAEGVPLVIHNHEKCVEEDCLLKWKIVGHFRYPPQRR